MNPSTVMLAREFYRNVLPAVFVGIGPLLVVISIHVVIGFGDSPSPLLASVCIGFIGIALAVTSPRSHHLNLPLTANHLSSVLVMNAWLVGVVPITIVLQFIGLVFDRPWNGLTSAMLGTSVCLVFVPLARLIAGKPAELFGVFVACNFGWWISSALPNHHGLLVGAVSLAMAVLGWQLSVIVINRERLGASTMAAMIKKWELSLSRKRREYRCRFPGPRQAIFQLDWIRLRFGVIGISLALIIGFGLVPLLVDPSILVLPLVACFLPTMAVLITSSFVDEDWKANGAFRWNLPIPDEHITSGLRKEVAATLLVVLLASHAAFLLIVLCLHSTDHLSLPAIGNESLFRSDIANTLLLSTLAVPVQFAIGWVSAMRGLETSLLDRGLTGRQLLLSCVWCVGLYLTTKYVPASSQPFAYGMLMAWVGVALLMRTARAFRWARIMKVIPDGLLPRAIVMWALGSTICIVFFAFYGFANMGMHVLSVGLLAALFQPAAALPIAVHLRRHYC